MTKTKSTPLVSIIVTCYNQELCIAKTLKSVTLQSYTHWECIIVDDGSTDTSAEVIETFVIKDKRFQYHYQDNQGVAKARNRGFALAKGQYINFLDGDDTFLPQKLEKQLDVFHNHPDVDICICDHQYYYEAEDKYAYYAFEKIQQHPLEQLLYGWHNGVAFPPHTAIYKRDIWSQNEQPFPADYTHRCEDWVFNVIVALKNCNYYWLDDVLCNYHLTGINYTSDSKSLAKASIHAAIYINKLIPEIYQASFIDHTIDNALRLALEQEKLQILRASGNWQLGYYLTRPFFWLKRKMIG